MNESNKHINTPIGIHRLLREPYDDREIFNNMTDLRDYCKNGARYNGQKVGCIIGVPGYTHGYIQNFTINNDYPIIELNNNELNIYGNDYIQIYYYNPCNNHNVPMYNPNKSHYNYLNDPFAFSILSLIDAFRPKDEDIYTFYIRKINPSTKKVLTCEFEETPELWNERVCNGTGLFRNNNSNPDSCFTASFRRIDGGPNYYETANIIPKTTNENTITELYIYAPEYIRAAGVI